MWCVYLALGGTAASSPMPQDDRTPEPDILGPSTLPSTVPIEDMSLDGVPLPVYPLPSRPFPVQPPQKIGTGFAPFVPLEKSGLHSRRWRQVNREVRGIAGGRWFVRTWAGGKDSQLATAVAALSADPSALAVGAAASFSRLSSISASVPGKPGARSKAAKAGAGSSNLVSRSGSLAPESISVPLPKRNGTLPGPAVSEGTTPTGIPFPPP